MMTSDLAYGLISTTVGWVVSEAIPAITKGRYGGVLHLIFVAGAKIYEGQDGAEDLRKDVADLRAKIAAMERPDGTGEA